MVKLIQGINYLMALLFVFAAALQYNDPDSLIWMGVYGGAAALCILWSYGKIKKPVAIPFALVCIIWSVMIMPDLAGHKIFGSFSMQSIEVEEVRESLGLLIAASWALILAFVPDGKRVTTETADELV